MTYVRWNVYTRVFFSFFYTELKIKCYRNTDGNNNVDKRLCDTAAVDRRGRHLNQLLDAGDPTRAAADRRLPAVTEGRYELVPRTRSVEHVQNRGVWSDPARRRRREAFGSQDGRSHWNDVDIGLRPKKTRVVSEQNYVLQDAGIHLTWGNYMLRVRSNAAQLFSDPWFSCNLNVKFCSSSRTVTRVYCWVRVLCVTHLNAFICCETNDLASLFSFGYYTSPVRVTRTAVYIGKRGIFLFQA